MHGKQLYQAHHVSLTMPAKEYSAPPKRRDNDTIIAMTPFKPFSRYARLTASAMAVTVAKAMALAIPIAIASLMLSASLPVSAMPIEQQRQVYLDAKRALKAGQITTFKKLAGSIQDYALYPYLLHDYMRPRLHKIEDAEMVRFLARYGDLPMAGAVHRAWLTALAKRQHWHTYLENYTAQSDITLQCYQLQARIKTGNEAGLLEDARRLWLASESQPPECDSAFAKLDKSDLLTGELIWQRITLAMDAGNVSLAQYLRQKLPQAEQHWVSKWIAIHHDADKGTKNIAYADTAISRNMIVHGMQRLTRISIDKTIKRWLTIKNQYDFSQEQINAVEKTLAVKAASKRHADAITLLNALDKSLIDAELFQWRLRAALDRKDWHMLKNWTTGPPPNEAVSTRWRFWHARALHSLGETEQALDIFTRLAEERDYYAFRAADRLNLEYALNHHPLPEDLQTWYTLAERPSVVRARELYILGQTYPARREWHHGLESMSPYEMQVAANIAANWGWHDRVILTLGKARAYDDLVLRFPLPYENRLREYAEKRGVDLQWMYALVRAESAFIETVRSPAGALGLMQVMPETGKDTAKSIAYGTFNTNMLRNEKHNVAIGSAYLQQMFARFNENYVLATAAYNAGPGNVSRWLPKNSCEDPEIWIEKIPFTETRKYVRRILYYASIYGWRLRQDIVPVGARIKKSIPTKKQLLAKLDCNKPNNYAQR